MRAIQIATLLIEQAELAAQPLFPEEAVRLIERAKKLRRIGEVEIARLCEERALQLARDHESYFLNETWRRNAMIRTAAKRFFWYFWMRGDRLVAGLVGEALGRKINPRRVRYIVAGR